MEREIREREGEGISGERAWRSPADYHNNSCPALPCPSPGLGLGYTPRLACTPSPLFVTFLALSQRTSQYSIAKHRESNNPHGHGPPTRRVHRGGCRGQRCVRDACLLLVPPAAPPEGRCVGHECLALLATKVQWSSESWPCAVRRCGGVATHSITVLVAAQGKQTPPNRERRCALRGPAYPAVRGAAVRGAHTLTHPLHIGETAKFGPMAWLPRHNGLSNYHF